MALTTRPPIGLLLSMEPLAYSAGHRLQLSLAQLGEHWQRQHLVGGAFGVRERTWPVSRIDIRRLQVNRNGIVDTGLNALEEQRLLQGIAARRAHGVDVIDVA